MYDQFINLSVKPYNKTKGCLNLNYVNASSSNNKGSIKYLILNQIIIKISFQSKLTVTKYQKRF